MPDLTARAREITVETSAIMANDKCMVLLECQTADGNFYVRIL